MGMKAEQFRRFKNDNNPVKMYLLTAASAPFWGITFTFFFIDHKKLCHFK